MQHAAKYISAMPHPDSFQSRASLDVGGRRYTIWRLDALSSAWLRTVSFAKPSFFIGFFMMSPQ